MGLIEGWDPIKIGIDPEIGHFGGLVLTWHGVFVAIGIAVGVWVAVRMAARVGFIEDDSYTIAMVGVVAGIIGARVLFVAENHSLFAGKPLDVFRINEGGISIYGALIGGVLGAILYNQLGLMVFAPIICPIVFIWVLFRRALRGPRVALGAGLDAIRALIRRALGAPRLPIRAGLDAAAFGMILGQGVGRIGDIINGEHFAKTTDLPWAVVYTHANSSSFGRAPQHPAVAYEFLGDLLIFGLLFLLWRFYKRDGLVFFSYAFLYSVLQMGTSALRLDNQVLWHFKMAQVIALVVIAISILGFAYCLRQAPGRRKVEVAVAPSPAPRRAQARR
jgi:phosphatidylglycerol:prolipoprotein diacylglycerol transferase